MYRRVRGWGKAANKMPVQAIRAASTQDQKTSYLIVAHLSQASTVLEEKETPAPPVHCPLEGPVEGGEVKGLRGPAETLQMLG